MVTGVEARAGVEDGVGGVTGVGDDLTNTSWAHAVRLKDSAAAMKINTCMVERFYPFEGCFVAVEVRCRLEKAKRLVWIGLRDGEDHSGDNPAVCHQQRDECGNERVVHSGEPRINAIKTCIDAVKSCI